MLHSGNSVLSDAADAEKCYNTVVQTKELKMLRQLFKSMVVARQASAAIETLNHMSDRQLEDIGFTRANYVEKIKAIVLAELDAQDAAKALKAPVHENLVGAV
jgi:uncharacterized protein YjiS (DUF1127 family)